MDNRIGYAWRHHDRGVATSKGPFDPRRPFTRAQATKAKISEWSLRSHRYVKIFRNVYISREVPRTPAIRARGAIAIAPEGAVISHHTAATLWGGSVPDSAAVNVTIQPDQVLEVGGIRTRERTRRPESTLHHGVPITTPEQTFLDMAGELDLVQLVVLGDRFVRRKVTTTDALIRAAAEWSGWHGGLAQRAAAYVRAGVDSPPETKLRMLVVLAGLPEPVVNHKICDPETGAVLRRFELAYPELLLALEYEGRHHRADDDIWAADIDRREEMDRRSWRIVQVISTGLHDDPLRTLRRIDQARIDRGCAPARQFGEEWQRYFPGKDVA